MTKVTIINMSEEERSDILASVRVLTDSLNLKILQLLNWNKKPASVDEIGEELEINNKDDLANIQFHILYLAEKGFLRGYYRANKDNTGIVKKYGPMMAKIKKTLQDFQRIVDSSIHPT